MEMHVKIIIQALFSRLENILKPSSLIVSLNMGRGILSNIADSNRKCLNILETSSNNY